MVDPGQLQKHPLSDLIPNMRPSEWEDLCTDIAIRGVKVPIETFDDGCTVADGHHRLRAAVKLGIEQVPVVQASLDGEDPSVYMLKAAVLRRHLTDDQRAQMAAKWSQLNKKKAGKPSKNASGRPAALKDARHPSRAQSIELFKVARWDIDRASYIQNHSPQLAEKVLQGEVKLGKAYKGAHEETSSQTSAEKQIQQRYSWQGIAVDLLNSLQRVIQTLQRLPDGKLPSEAPREDVEKLQFRLTQGSTIFANLLQQLAKVQAISSKPMGEEQSNGSVQMWQKNTSIITGAACKTVEDWLKYGEVPDSVLRADWQVRYLRLHGRSYEEMKRQSPFYRSPFALSGIGARHGGLSSFAQNVGAFAVRFFTPSRLEEPGHFSNHLPTVLDPFAGPNSRLELTWRCKRNYLGWDCCHEFMAQNRQVRDLLYRINEQCPIRRGAQIDLTEDDSRHINYNSVADMLLTSIPYWDTEYYGPEAAQLGKTKTYEGFLESLLQIFSRCYAGLKAGAYVVVEAQNIRRKGKSYPLGVLDVIDVLKDAGFVFSDLCTVDYGSAFGAHFLSQVEKLKILPKRTGFLSVARKPESKLLKTEEVGRGFEREDGLA